MEGATATADVEGVFFNGIVQNIKKTDVWCLQKLTQHHSFTTASGSKACMLGEDHNKNVEEVLRALKNNQEMSTKEKHPILCLIASPRQGKSLFLNVLSERVQKADQFVVCISYNSTTLAYVSKKHGIMILDPCDSCCCQCSSDEGEDSMGCV